MYARRRALYMALVHVHVYVGLRACDEVIYGHVSLDELTF